MWRWCGNSAMMPVMNSTSEAEYTDRENPEMSTNSRKVKNSEMSKNSASEAEYTFRVNPEMSKNLGSPSTAVRTAV